jgi:hypothetical protein
LVTQIEAEWVCAYDLDGTAGAYVEREELRERRRARINETAGANMFTELDDAIVRDLRGSVVD